MDHSDLQVGCLGNFFKSRSRTTRPKSSSQPCDSQVARIELSGEYKGRSEVPNESQEQQKDSEGIQYFSPHCDYSYSPSNEWWTSTEPRPPSYTAKETFYADNNASVAIEQTVDKLNPKLRALSLKIHGHPELQFQERFAHDLLTNFMAEHGFDVTKHYLGLETAWRAEFSQGTGGRVIGVNSEMDALQGMGHACGHNLIAVSGVGIAISLKAALQAQRHVSGKVVLLGTPAEENGGGKIILLKRGGYADMDACIMCHPAPGMPYSSSVGATIALQQIDVEYFGHGAHAGAAPWEGINALDAAFSAYSNISMLRQQIKPDHRIHGIVHGKNWLPNVIPDYSKMQWLVRTPTFSELTMLVERVQNCLKAASLATSCRIEMKLADPYLNLHQNPILAQGFADIVGNRYGWLTRTDATTASTDFGNVSCALPALHPAYAIPTEPRGGNHTPAFARAAISQAAHDATMVITKALAMTGYRVISDFDFFCKVRDSFEQSKL
ncbi:amidohydrolase [Phlegmacium glaucopus]|nr:amidohydrolase [Phlegmacium glaucopus]